MILKKVFSNALLEMIKRMYLLLSYDELVDFYLWNWFIKKWGFYPKYIKCWFWKDKWNWCWKCGIRLILMRMVELDTYYHSYLEIWKVQLYWKLFIYLEISVLDNWWRIAIIVVEIAWELGELKLSSHPWHWAFLHIYYIENAHCFEKNGWI